MSFGTFFLADSYAGTVAAPRSHSDFQEVLLQIVVHNSDGMLVSYIEPGIFYFRNIELLHDFLDEQEDKKIVTIDGKQHEQIDWKYKYITRKSGDQQSGYEIGHKGYGILNARLNGSISGEGDIVTAYWRIIRAI